MYFLSKTHNKSIKCFFCNHYVKVLKISENTSKGKYPSWVCPECESLNVYDENGDIADYVPPETSELPPKYSTCNTSSLPLKSPFCSNCITNQSIINASIAEYLPDKSNPDYNAYIIGFKPYINELEKRFPPVCENCIQTVTERLNRNNYLTKSTILGSIINYNDFGKDENYNGFKKKKKIHFIKIFFWYIRGFLWWISNLLSLLWYVYGIFLPDLQQKIILDSFNYKLKDFLIIYKYNSYLYLIFGLIYYLVNKIIPFSILFIFWDYKWLEAISSPTSLRIDGKKSYFKSQFIFFLINLFSLYLIPKLKYSIRTTEKGTRYVNEFFFIISLILLINSLSCLKIIYKPFISLSDKKDEQLEEKLSRNINDKIEKKLLSKNINNNIQKETNANDHLINSLSLESDINNLQKKLNSSYPTSSFTGNLPYPSIRKVNTQDNITQINHSNQQLAPQKLFIKDDSTGLESLFSPALSLDDTPVIVSVFKSAYLSLIFKRKIIQLILSLLTVLCYIICLFEFKYLLFMNIYIQGKHLFYLSNIFFYFSIIYRFRTMHLFQRMTKDETDQEIKYYYYDNKFKGIIVVLFFLVLSVLSSLLEYGSLINIRNSILTKSFDFNFSFWRSFVYFSSVFGFLLYDVFSTLKEQVFLKRNKGKNNKKILSTKKSLHTNSLGSFFDKSLSANAPLDKYMLKR